MHGMVKIFVNVGRWRGVAGLEGGGGGSRYFLKFLYKPSFCFCLVSNGVYCWTKVHGLF